MVEMQVAVAVAPQHATWLQSSSLRSSRAGEGGAIARDIMEARALR